MPRGLSVRPVHFERYATTVAAFRPPRHHPHHARRLAANAFVEPWRSEPKERYRVGDACPSERTHGAFNHIPRYKRRAARASLSRALTPARSPASHSSRHLAGICLATSSIRSIALYPLERCHDTKVIP